MSSIDIRPRVRTPVLARRSSQLRGREFTELTIVYATILLALWIDKPMQLAIGGVTMIYVIARTLSSRQSSRELGLAPRLGLTSLWITGAALGCGAVLVTTAARLHTLHLNGHGAAPAKSIAAYLAWSLLQQFVLLDFFLLRLRRLLTNVRAAVIVTATLFAAAHLPNPLLTMATLIWGTIAAALFLRHRNLYVLALAHAVLGLSLAVSVPNAIHHNMRVGLGYQEWRSPRAVQRSHRNQMVSTEAWVMAEATRRCSHRQALP